MLKKLFKNKKAQNTAEYAILISLVVAGIVAMQTYAQRALQARVKDSADVMTSIVGTSDVQNSWSDVGGNALGSTKQYEPYYLAQDYNVYRDDSEEKGYDTAGFYVDSNGERRRRGKQTTTYNESGTVGTGMSGLSKSPTP
ncbi:MAG TPA: hypothetical protein PLH56_04685 [Candidatus Omnitrophota bacterium]|nr:hypothetical protein [Candidatus Omnitrophota bacterium]